MFKLFRETVILYVKTLFYTFCCPRDILIFIFFVFMLQFCIFIYLLLAKSYFTDIFWPNLLNSFGISG